jgi:glycosyltransferase involved in cell wall biosynthesis
VPFGGNRPESHPNFDARRLLCVARFEPHKNHLALLAACEMLWRDGIQFELHLIGCLAYPDDAWRIWRRLRALRKAGYPIQWHGHVSEAELHAAYRDCSATVFPSLIEGFGLPILESLWHGRPVVCGENGALGEVASGGGCKTAEMRDPAEMASAIRSVLTDPKCYETLFAETQKRVFRTWKDYWSATTEFIGMEVPVLEKAGETQITRP